MRGGGPDAGFFSSLPAKAASSRLQLCGPLRVVAQDRAGGEAVQLQFAR
jgi:hypothetical protein